MMSTPTNENNSELHLFLPRNDARSRQLKVMLHQSTSAVQLSNIDFFSILPAPDKVALKQQLQNVDQADLLVLVSINAIKQFCQTLREWQWELPQVPIAVMGQTSKAACQQRGLKVTYLPLDGNDSEALLRTLDKQNWENKQVIILRAQDGRDYLAAQLKERGAYVDIVALYQRFENTQIAEAVMQAQENKNPLTHVLLSSQSVAEIWQRMLNEKRVDLKVGQVKWLCLSERIAGYWRGLYSKANITVLPQTTDEAIYAAILQDLQD